MGKTGKNVMPDHTADKQLTLRTWQKTVKQLPQSGLSFLK